MRSLPVPEGVLKRHVDAIAPAFTKKKAQMLQVRHAAAANTQETTTVSVCVNQSL
jgi:hypothetical protein